MNAAADEAAERDEQPRAGAGFWRKQDEPGRIRIINGLRHFAGWSIGPSARAAESPNGGYTNRADAPTPREGHARLLDSSSGEEAERAGDDGVGALLAAIGDDVARLSAGATAGIVAEFSARIAAASKNPSRHERQAAVRALKEARKAALATVKRATKAELTARRRLAIETRPKRPSAGRPALPVLEQH
jgi:hypothetical protein